MACETPQVSEADGGALSAWWRHSRGRRVAVLLIVAFVLFLAAGATWATANPGVTSYRPATAVVTGTTPSASITVQFETIRGESVEAITSRLTFVPPVGAPVPIRYDPSDPSQVVMEGYSDTPFVTKVLVGLFGVSLAAAWLAFRRD